MRARDAMQSDTQHARNECTRRLDLSCVAEFDEPEAAVDHHTPAQNMSRNLKSGDALDREQFDAIAFLNDAFPTEQSLTLVDTSTGTSFPPLVYSTSIL